MSPTLPTEKKIFISIADITLVFRTHFLRPFVLLQKYLFQTSDIHNITTANGVPKDLIMKAALFGK